MLIRRGPHPQSMPVFQDTFAGSFATWKIQQVVVNLMLNGIEAMNDAGGVLTVKSRAAAGRDRPDLDAFFTNKQ
jgi:phosphoglycerate-specific signal transduction histidine kinase